MIFPIENENFQVIYKWNLFSSQKKRKCDKDRAILHCATLTYQIKHITIKCPIYSKCSYQLDKLSSTQTLLYLFSHCS